MTQPGAPVMRAAGGRVVVRLEESERRILASLVAELRSELEDPASAAPEGSLGRLYPPAFPDEPEAEAGYRKLVQPGLVDGRLQQVAAVEASLDAGELDGAQAAAWLGVLNDLRLALGSRLGIEDDRSVVGGTGPADGDDPDAMRRAVFLYLGWLVECFVDVLADSLPEVGEGGD